MKRSYYDSTVEFALADDNFYPATLEDIRLAERHGDLDWLMALEAAADGSVTILMGNHEMMNLLAHVRDTTAADFAAFAEESSGERRDDAWEDYARLLRATAERRRLPPPALDDAAREAWNLGRPPGFVERTAAFGPGGKYGEWLRQLPVIVKKGTSVFLHAGVYPNLPDLSLEGLNQRVRDEIALFDRYIAYLGACRT